MSLHRTLNDNILGCSIFIIYVASFMISARIAIILCKEEMRYRLLRWAVLAVYVAILIATSVWEAKHR